MKTRKPAVSGRFYPSDKNELSKMLAQILKSEKEKIKIELSEREIIGAVVPHAGYIYSAYQAVHFFEILKQSEQKFDTFVILNPNHTGYGAEIALDDNDFWETPFGKVPVDTEFAESTGFEFSAEAHKYEHSGEVMLPFLQYFRNYDFKILPITISHQTVENAKLIAEKLHETSKLLNRKIAIIASSDFSHYVNPEFGKKTDMQVIEKILNFDSEGTYKIVKDKKISMCGYAPVISLMHYSKFTF